MPRPRQPLKLLEAKGKKHLTSTEKEKRRATEVDAPADGIAAPEYLYAKEKAEFIKSSDQLKQIGIMSNLDCDTLARYIQSESKYLQYDKFVNRILYSISKQRSAASKDEAMAANCVILEKYEGLRDKALKQCRASASDLGLTISSRCKLVVPKKEEPQKSKWDNYKAGGASG